MKLFLPAFFLSCILGPLGAASGAPTEAPDFSRYNVIWDSPSEDQTGLMPIGNGDMGASVGATKDGVLSLLLSKCDAFNFAGELFKLGRVNIAIQPNPFVDAPFRQTLDIETGSILIEAGKVRIRVWADMSRNLLHVEINSPEPIEVTATPDYWKRIDGTFDSWIERGDRIASYYAVGDNSSFLPELKSYGVEHMKDSFPDPYKFNTFGYLLDSPELTLVPGDRDSGRVPALRGKGRSFDIRIHALTKQTPDVEEWVSALETEANRPVDLARDWQEHLDWWKAFWQRSWIIASDRTVPSEQSERFLSEAAPDGTRQETDGAALASQSYNVFRFLMACQSRGPIQTKFNGGLFSQPERIADGKIHAFRKKAEMRGNKIGETAVQQPDGSWITHEDDRLWWRRFTFQNQRLLYWPLLMSGDYDLTQPFFDFYFRTLPMRKAITKAWFEQDGAFFRENMMPTGVDVDNNGNPPKTKPGETYTGGYHHYHFIAGPELVAMMIAYVKHTGDMQFAKEKLLPVAREVLLFYDLHYSRDAKGKLRIEPSQVLETWWVASNPTPEIAGLRHCMEELLAMDLGTEEDKTQWKRFLSEIPEIPLREIDGRMAIAPAETFSNKRNLENGELYAVFPFPYFGRAFGNEDIVEWTIQNATEKRWVSLCWAQNEIMSAHAGDAATTVKGLDARFRRASTALRFPLFGRESPDSCPDFDHFGSGSVALQKMLVQEGNGKILLLPAWPSQWDANFKLHVSRGGIVTGTVRDGKLVEWDIQPASLRSKVVVCEPQ